MKNKIYNLFLTSDTVTINNYNSASYKINTMMLNKYKSSKATPEDIATLGYDIFINLFSAIQDDILKELENLNIDDRLTLNIESNDPLVHNIPFELMNKNATLNGYLLKKPNISIIRGVPSLKKELSKPTPKQIKILFLLSMPLETLNQNALDPLHEIERIYRALSPYINNSQVIIDIEEKVTIPNIKKRLSNSEYDILHFSGHGGANGELIIEDENGRDEKVASKDELKDIFAGCNIKLFYLDSCLGAYSNYSSSLAYELYTLLPNASIVANLTTISDEFAMKSVEKFYENIFSKSLDFALVESRVSSHKEWSKTVIYTAPNNKSIALVIFDLEVFETSTAFGCARKSADFSFWFILSAFVKISIIS